MDSKEEEAKNISKFRVENLSSFDSAASVELPLSSAYDAEPCAEYSIHYPYYPDISQYSFEIF